MYREFFLSSRCAIPWNCRSEKREGLPGDRTEATPNGNTAEGDGALNSLTTDQ